MSNPHRIPNFVVKKSSAIKTLVILIGTYLLARNKTFNLNLVIFSIVAFSSGIALIK